MTAKKMKKRGSGSEGYKKNSPESLCRRALIFLSDKIPIRVALIIPFTIIIVTTVGLTGYLSFVNGHKVVHNLAIQMNHEISARVHDRLLFMVESAHRLNRIHSNAFALKQIKPDDVRGQERHFWSQIQLFKQISHSFFCNVSGEFVGARLLDNGSFGTMLGDESTNSNQSYHYFTNDTRGNRTGLMLTRPKTDARERSWYTQAVKAKKSTWSPIYTTLDANALAISASRPIYNEAGQLQGVLGSNFNFAKVHDFLSSIEIGKTGEVFIIERSGMLVSSSTSAPHTVKKGEKIVRIPAMDSENNLVKKSARYINSQFGRLDNIKHNNNYHFISDGAHYFLQLTPLQDTRGLDWLIAVAVPENDFMEKINESNLTTLMMMLIALLLATGAGIGMARWILRPISHLNQSAIALAKGDWNQSVDISRKDELGQLANSFNTMVNYINSLLHDLKQNVVELNNEVEQRKIVEENLTKAQKYISNIIDSMPSVLVGVDSDGSITQWNLAAEQKTGIPLSVAHGEQLADIFPQMAAEQKKINDSIRTCEIKQELKKFSMTERGICYEDVTIYPLIADGIEGAVIRIDDVTEKVRMEETIIQSEKMLSVGGLAAGMAHEINNPLAGIIQTVEVMSKRLSDTAMPANIRIAEELGMNIDLLKTFMEKRDIFRMISAITESGQRIADIVSNMLNFARKSDSETSSHDLTELLDRTIEIASTDYDLKKQYDFKTIAIVKEYEHNLPVVPCDGGKIQQVLLNLLRNGAQAMQEVANKKPQFILSVRLEENKKMVAIGIKDNGHGMDEEIRKRVFEPFFTTKPAGIGTGLGLSVSYFIITENHNGELSVESSPGKGTKFIIRLPLEEKTNDEKKK